MSAGKIVPITAELTDDEAWQLAQFIKRLSFSGARECARDDDETYVMLEALGKVRRSLSEAGYAPR